ncbi:unnamed protein product, partial [Owenia fusiformis]
VVPLKEFNCIIQSQNNIRYQINYSNLRNNIVLFSSPGLLPLYRPAPHSSTNSTLEKNRRHNLEPNQMFIEDTKEYNCIFCPHKFFPTKACLDFHTAVVHNKFCEVCNQRLDDEPNVEEHGLRHTGEKDFQCEFCYRLVGTAAGLAYHKMKDLQCLICGKMVQIVRKAKHMRLHQQ